MDSPATNSIPNLFPEPLAPPEATYPTAPPACPVDVQDLYAASAEIGGILDLEILYPRILRHALKLINASTGSLMLLDNQTRRLMIVAAQNIDNSIVQQTQVLLGDGVAGWVAQRRQPLLLIGPIDSKDYPKSFPRPEQISSSIIVPLLQTNAHAPDTLLGVLNLVRPIGLPPLTQQDLRVACAFALHVVVSLENARAFQELRRRAEQTQHLIALSRGIVNSLDVNQVLESMMARAVELLNAQAGSLYLVDEQTQELIFQVVKGPASEQLTGTRLPPGVGIAGMTAQEGKPLIVNNAQGDPRHYTKIDQTTTLTTHSILSVPLLDQDRVVGVIQVINKKDGTAFEKSDCDILTAFALQGAIALRNAQLYSDLRRSFAETVQIIANAVEARDPNTAGHTQRVTQIAKLLAIELGWSKTQIDILEIGASLHDIGKIGISDTILRKPEGLTIEEYNQMKQHPVLGAQLLRGVGALQPMLPYILYHQERYDGLGYPFGLKGEEIPIEGRLLAVADTFDAMTSTRPYRVGMDQARALEEIQSRRGTQYDPQVVDALVAICAHGLVQSILESNQPDLVVEA